MAPLCVHATYSLDNHDGIAKRQRFAEAALWAAHPPGYYEEGRYLALAYSMSPAVLQRIEHYKRTGVKPANIDVHAQALRT